MKDDGERMLERVRRPKGRPRGTAAKRLGGWEPSATDQQQQVPDADYRKRLEAWEESDMDQSGEDD